MSSSFFSSSTEADASTTTIAAAEPKAAASSLACPRVAPLPPSGAGNDDEAFECMSSSSSGGSGGSDDEDSSVGFVDGEEAVAVAGDGDGGLVQRVAAYFFESESFADTFEAWVRAKAGRIDLGTTECRLEYTALFEEFQALFEAEMMGFIEAQGATVEGFYEQLARRAAADPWSNEGVFAQILVAVVEFDVFMLMMREAAEKEALARAKAEEEAVQETQEGGKGEEAKKEMWGGTGAVRASDSRSETSNNATN